MVERRDVRVNVMEKGRHAQYSSSELEEILIRWAKEGKLHNDIIEFNIYSCAPED